MKRRLSRTGEQLRRWKAESASGCVHEIVQAKYALGADVTGHLDELKFCDIDPWQLLCLS